MYNFGDQYTYRRMLILLYIYYDSTSQVFHSELYVTSLDLDNEEDSLKHLNSMFYFVTICSVEVYIVFL